MNATNAASEKLALFIDRLPQDLALMVVLSGLSLNVDKVARAVEIASALMVLRQLDAEKKSNPEHIVENTMADFQRVLDKSMEKK